MQLTTREAVAIVLGEASAQCCAYEPECVRCKAVKRLCETYGFKLTDYFEGVE